MIEQFDLMSYVLPAFKFPDDHKIRLFEAFSGIGCQRLALKRLTDNYESVGVSEIDKPALKSYEAIHGDCKNFGSITDIHELPQIDIFTWSFPCTDLSKAGKQAGMGSKLKGQEQTRSGLCYEVLRVLHENEHNLPRVLIMENVIDLIQVKFIRSFNEIQREIESLGYKNYTFVLNGKNYGIPQNRERVFMVSILGDYFYEPPKPFKLEKRLKDLLEDNVDEKYYLSKKLINYVCSRMPSGSNKITTGIHMENRDSDAIAGAVTTCAGNRATDNFIIQNDDVKYSKEKGCLVYKNEEINVKRVGGLYDTPERKRTRGEIFDSNGLSPTLNTCGGGYGMPLTLCDNLTTKNKQIIETKENNDLEDGMFLDFYNRKTSKDISGTITTRINDSSTSGVVEGGVIIPNATKKGYLIAQDGDGVDISGRMKYHRGTVQKGMSQTLKTGSDVGVCVLGNYMPSGHNASRIVDEIGLAPCVKENHGTVTAVGIPLTKDTENYIEWHEGGKYDSDCRAWKIDKVSPTTTTTKPPKILNNNLRIRKLTPKECWRLMGIDDSDFEKAQKVTSNAQLYKQAGNGIIVDVFYYILRGLVNESRVKPL